MYLNDDFIDKVTENMKGLADNVVKVDFDDIEDYDFPQDEPFGLQVELHDELYCFIIRFSSTNKNFMCMGPGAHARGKLSKEGKLIEPPFFVRWKWYNYFEESVIAYADPVMFHNDDVRITWFTGNPDYWPMEDVAAIIEKLAINQEVKNDNIMFFGSSGGGFSSVMLGSLVKKSKVLVNNPQLFVVNYYKSNVDKLFDLLREEFEGLSREEITEKIRYRLDVIESFNRQNYVPPITCYVNVKSVNDMESQIFPFLSKYYELDNPNYINIIYYHDPNVEKAHDPLPTPETLDVIREFVANYLHNTDEVIISNEDRVLDRRNSIEILTEQLAEFRYENKQLNRHYVRFKKKIENLAFENRKLNRKVDSLRNSNNKLKNEIETRKKTMKTQDSQLRWFRKYQSDRESSKSYKLLMMYRKIKNKL